MKEAVTNPDLQKQREESTWIDELLQAAKMRLTLRAAHPIVNRYIEHGADFIRFQRDGKLWELSIKEKKPRKQRVKK